MGIFPDQLKIAKVVPLHKKDEQYLMGNYRPVSLLASISKIFEKVAHKQLSKYFEQNKLFYDSQYGFRQGHSTELASVELIDRITASLEQKNKPIAIYMDLSKAFDTLDHIILLNKLRYYGIDGVELKWFKSYLQNRKQYVEIDANKSELKNITTGVPQGSVLGPLLFLIYMNDIQEASAAFSSVLFADDSTFINSMNASIHTNTTNADLELFLNVELAKIYDWLAINKLSLNISKTKYMIFHAANTTIQFVPHLSINDTSLEKVKNFNFLGLTINENLSWKPHGDKISSKISKYCGVLNRLKRFLPIDILRLIYCIQSNINYSILSWGYDCGRLVKLQKKAIRIMTCSQYNSHTEPLFKVLNLLKIEDMLKLSTLNFIYKLNNNKLPTYFKSYHYHSQFEIHRRNTRFTHLIPTNLRQPMEGRNV